MWTPGCQEGQRRPFALKQEAEKLLQGQTRTWLMTSFNSNTENCIEKPWKVMKIVSIGYKENSNKERRQWLTPGKKLFFFFKKRNFSMLLSQQWTVFCLTVIRMQTLSFDYPKLSYNCTGKMGVRTQSVCRKWDDWATSLGIWELILNHPQAKVETKSKIGSPWNSRKKLLKDYEKFTSGE